MKYEKMPLERIRNFRVDNDLTQEYVAKYLNVAQNTYCQYETGTLGYNVDVLIKLAKLYNTSVDYLLELTDKQKPYDRKTIVRDNHEI